MDPLTQYGPLGVVVVALAGVVTQLIRVRRANGEEHRAAILELSTALAALAVKVDTLTCHVRDIKEEVVGIRSVVTQVAVHEARLTRIERETP